MARLRIDLLPPELVPTVQHIVPVMSADGATRHMTVEQIAGLASDLALTLVRGGVSSDLDTLQKLATELEGYLRTDGDLGDLLDKPASRTSLGLGYSDPTEAEATRASLLAASIADLGNNFLVNPNHRVSQEYAGTAVTTNGTFPSDQWQLLHSSDGAVSAQRVASQTPAGSPYRLRVSVTTADASLAAGQYLGVSQPLEASRMAAFRFGTPNAKPGTMRFGFKMPAGTYGVTLQNAAQNRSFVGLVTIDAGEANTDVVKTVAFTGDTSGTWLDTDVLGWYLIISLAAGTTRQAPVAGWNAGNYWTTAAQTNGLSSNTNVFEIFDAGLRLDPNGTGLYGRYLPTNLVLDLLDCRRYFRRVGAGFTGVMTSSTAAIMWGSQQGMRVNNPVTAGINGSGSNMVYDSAGQARTFTTFGSVGAGNAGGDPAADDFQVSIMMSGGTVSLTAGTLIFGSKSFLTLNGRM